MDSLNESTDKHINATIFLLNIAEEVRRTIIPSLNLALTEIKVRERERETIHT